MVKRPGKFCVAIVIAAAALSLALAPVAQAASRSKSSRSKRGPTAHAPSPKRSLLSREFPRQVVDRLWLADYDAIDEATSLGWLVDVPSDPDVLGVVLRTRGSSPIGEKERDPRLRAKLMRLAVPAAALLYRLADQLREQEGERFVPLEVTSLVRPWTYQVGLMRSNPNADVTKAGVPPTHVLGLAFDIPRGDMSPDRQRRLEGMLEDLERWGTAIYFKEGSSQSTFHVAVLPSAFPELEHEYHSYLVGPPEPDSGLECDAGADDSTTWADGGVK